jgi:hypothetical protein
LLSFNYEFIKDNFWWRRWKYSILVDLFDQINLHCEQMLPEILFRNGINNISNMYCENIFFPSWNDFAIISRETKWQTLVRNDFLQFLLFSLLLLTIIKGYDRQRPGLPHFCKQKFISLSPFLYPFSLTPLSLGFCLCASFSISVSTLFSR